MGRGVVVAATLGVVVGTVMARTAASLEAWSWVLTVTQALVFLLCSRDDRRGWLVGLSLQPAWATYACLTGQPSFLVTGAVITAANLGALKRHRLDEEKPEPGSC